MIGIHNRRYAFDSYLPVVALGLAGVGLIKLGRWLAHGSIHADLGGED